MTIPQMRFPIPLKFAVALALIDKLVLLFHVGLNSLLPSNYANTGLLDLLYTVFCRVPILIQTKN